MLSLSQEVVTLATVDPVYAPVTAGYLTRMANLGVSGKATTEQITIAARFMLPAGHASSVTLFEVNTGTLLKVTALGALEFDARSAAGPSLGTRRVSGFGAFDGIEHTVVAFADTSLTPPVLEVWIDGVKRTLNNATPITKSPIGVDRSNFYGVAAQSDATERLPAEGYIRWLYVNVDAAIDGATFSAAANPATVGKPHLFFGGTLADWNAGTNKGSVAGAWTVAGTFAEWLPPVITPAATAFPQAVGAGAGTLGAYAASASPVIRRVTSTANSGPGTFRDAVADDLPAIIHFDVGGHFSIDRFLPVGSNKTIIGESAPRPVTFTSHNRDPDATNNDSIRIRGNEVVMTGISVRPGGEAIAADGIAVGDGNGGVNSNVIVAYCSVSWAGDENVSAYGSPRNVTFLYNIIADAPEQPGANGYAFHIAASDFTRENHTPTVNVDAIRNFVSTYEARGPGFRNAYNCTIAENIFHNWDDSAMLYYDEAFSGFNAAPYNNTPRIELLNNHFVPGPDTDGAVNNLFELYRSVPNGSYHFAGNMTYPYIQTTDDGAGGVAKRATPIVAENWTYFDEVGSITAAFKSVTPLTTYLSASRVVVQEFDRTAARIYTPTITTLSALVTDLKANAGARMNGVLSGVDNRIWTRYDSNTPVIPASPTSNYSAYNDWSEFDPTFDWNTLPPLDPRGRADTNADGIFDAYETAMGRPIGSLAPHMLIDASVQGLNARWEGHRQIMHQAYWLRTGNLDVAS